MKAQDTPEVGCSTCGVVTNERASTRASNHTPSIVLHVEGMDCADEVALIDRKLKSLRGVWDFETNLMNQQVRVFYDPAAVSVQDILKAIAETGMKARIEREVKEKILRWWQEPKIRLLLASGVFTLTAFIAKHLGLSQPAVRFIYAAAIVIGGYYPARIGLGALRTRTLNINTLLVVAALGAIGLGLWEEAAVLVFVYSLGNVLEAYAVDKARGSIRALMELVPKEALVRRDEREITLPVEEIRIGDVIIVRPGEKIPMDGVVSAGTSAVDQAPITGESLPVTKHAGDEVFAGTLNGRGALEVKVTKLSKDTTLAKIIHSVEEAQAQKSTYQRFGEKFGKVYTPAMFALALAVMLLPPLILNASWTPWVYRGLVLLVVSCSCGLALSIPVAVVAAIGHGARHGVLFKGGAYLEAAGRLRVIAFDKTGTLTLGKPRVTDVVPLNGFAKEVLRLAAAVEARSEHPLAEAILRYAREEGVVIPKVEEFEALPGLGARAVANGKVVTIGTRRLFAHLSDAEDELARLEAQGKTAILVGDSEKLLGLVAVADQLRPEAPKAIRELKKAGIKKIVMLTGDNEGTARAIASEAGVDEYRAELLPEDKVAVVRELRSLYGAVAMVGDGVNDAPAMAAADVGIAMGAAGTDVAIETGDLALMSDDLTKLPYGLRLSRKAVANMKQNVVASLAIVAFLVPAALVGWIGLVPGLLINEMSALIVIANGVRLLKTKVG